MDHLDRLEQAAKQAEEDFLDREEYASGRGYDLAELRAATRKIGELLRMYRAGELERGPDTGEFIDASILQQAELLAHMRTRFPQWLAEEQARFDACLAWVAAANSHAAAWTRRGGDPVEQILANQLGSVLDQA